MKKRPLSAAELKRLVLYKRRLHSSNLSRPEESRWTEEQISKIANRDVRSGYVNDHGRKGLK